MQQVSSKAPRHRLPFNSLLRVIHDAAGNGYTAASAIPRCYDEISKAYHKIVSTTLWKG